MADEQRALVFLKRRFARAIENGDHETATRLRLELDLLMNGRLARAGRGDEPAGGDPESGPDRGSADGGILEPDGNPEPEPSPSGLDPRVVAPARGARREPLLAGLDWLAVESQGA